MDEKRRLWMEAALTVPETLLHVGTSEGVLASIDDACKLLGENIWASEDDDYSDAESGPDSPSQLSEHGDGFGVVVLATTCGLEHTICTPMFTAVDAGQSYRSALPFHPTSGGDGIFGSEGFNSQSDEIDIARGGVGFRSGSHDNTVRGGEGYIGAPGGFSSEGDAPAYDERFHGTLIGDAAYDYMANRIAGALAPYGPLTAAHREITRLVALHGEAGHVLALCAAPLGLLLRRDVDDDPDRASFLPNAHAALRCLGSAASATAAAEDFLRSRSARSKARCSGPWSVVTQLVGDAKRDVLEARRAVERMQDAAVRDFFHAWMVIKRAPSS